MDVRELVRQHGEGTGQDADRVEHAVAEVDDVPASGAFAQALDETRNGGLGQAVERVLHLARQRQAGQSLLLGGGQHSLCYGHHACHKAYGELLARVREEGLLTTVEALLEWDEETYMPPGGVENRSEQLALLAGLMHEQGTDPRIGDLLAEVEGSDLVVDPMSPVAVNVRVLRREYDRSIRMPRRLVEQVARTTALAQKAWAAARAETRFALFRPWLEQIVELKRAEAECVGYEAEPYDALIEDYEPGLSSAVVARLFEALRLALVPLAARIAAARRQPDASLLKRHFPRDRQQAFGARVASTVGFDFTRGRLDLAIHPSCTGIGPGDCRITARFDDRDFAGGVLTISTKSVTPSTTRDSTPRTTARRWVRRSRSGWTNRRRGSGRTRGAEPRILGALYPRARGSFREPRRRGPRRFLLRPQSGQSARSSGSTPTRSPTTSTCWCASSSSARWCRAISRAADLPAAWNAAYRDALGLVPANDAEGCLQDGHWADGLLGYFPTYTLGDVFAAQLFARAEQELGDLGEQFARGEFVSWCAGWASGYTQGAPVSVRRG